MSISDLVPNNETSGKDLDDYFRKTKAKPSIYWLSLTEEQVSFDSSILNPSDSMFLILQIVERDRQAERRRAEREANAALVEKVNFGAQLSLKSAIVLF